MSRTTLDYLFQVESPWISAGPGEPEREAFNPSHFYSRKDLSVCVRRLRGQKMRTTVALMSEFAAALQFPSAFGENWYALEECLAYLDEWLPADAYVLVVERAEEVLQDDGVGEVVTLLRVLHATGEFWAKPIEDGDRFDRPSVPFHVLLNMTSKVIPADSDIARAARDASVPLRW